MKPIAFSALNDEIARRQICRIGLYSLSARSRDKQVPESLRGRDTLRIDAEFDRYAQFSPRDRSNK